MKLNQESALLFAAEYRRLYAAHYSDDNPPPLDEIVERLNRLADKLPEYEGEAWQGELHIYAYPDEGYARIEAEFTFSESVDLAEPAPPVVD